MNTAAPGLAYQTEQKSSGGQAPDELNFLTQIWMSHSSKNGDRTNSLLSTQPQKAASLPTSPAAASTAFASQSALSASDAILNVGQLRKELPARPTSVQSQAGDALLQAFSDLPQQHSLKVNTAQLAAPTHARSVDSGSRAASPFWMQQRSAPSPVPSQGLPGSAAQSTGVFLGAPAYNNLDAAASQSAQAYAQQLQGHQPRSPLTEALHPKAAAQAAANAARAAAALHQQRPSGVGPAAGSPFWVTTGYAGGANQPAAVNVNSVPGFNPQIPAQQLHQLANQRLPLHLQLNNPQLHTRPQAYHAGLGNATYIPGTGLQYGNAAHLQQRAPIAPHAADAAYLQQDPNVLAAATAATANAAALKRAAGLPPHVQQQLLSNGHLAPRPSASPFGENDINLAGLTPAQLQMLISSPPEQVWRLAGQMGVFKQQQQQQQRRNGQVGLPVRAPIANGFAGNGHSASQANYINAMAHLHQLHGQHNQTAQPPTVNTAAEHSGPDGYPQQLTGGLLQQQVLRAQQLQQQQQQHPQVNDAHRILLELGKTLAGLGITVEAAINAGLLGGLAVADVHTLCDAHAAEVRRMQVAGLAPQPHLAHHFLGVQAAPKPLAVGDLLGHAGNHAAVTNPAALAAARQHALLGGNAQSNLQGQNALQRLAAGLPAGADTNNLTTQELEQLLMLRQLQASGQYPPSNAAPGAPTAYGSVSSAPGSNFRTTSPAPLNSFRTASPSFGTNFGGAMSPAYSTHSLPAGLNPQGKPGSAFGHGSMGGGSLIVDPVIRRPSPNPSIASHASKPGSPRKPAQVPGNNNSPISARTFNCASYSFFGSADSHHEVSLESPHSADAAWGLAKATGGKGDNASLSLEGSGSNPELNGTESGGAHSEGNTKQESPAKHDLPVPTPGHGKFGEVRVPGGQEIGGEDLGVPTDEEILMSHLNLGPGF